MVNEPELAEAIERLRGEWAERSGGSLTAESRPWNDVAASIEADVILFPSRYLGELCTGDGLRPVRPNVLQSREFNAADVFPLVRHQLIRWGGQTMALPLGVDLTAAGEPIRRPPAIRWLTHAAPHLVSNDRIGVLFDPQTMKPRITEPPFIDALQQFAESNADDRSTRSAEAQRVPVLGYADRLAAVTTASRNAASAFQLVGWLAAPEISSQLARAGEGTLPVRRSLASLPAWHDPKLTSDERTELATELTAALSQHQCLLIPRIPGIDDYLAALDDAIQAAVAHPADAHTALQQAAAAWEKISESRGRDAQRTAYAKHLSISEP